MNNNEIMNNEGRLATKEVIENAGLSKGVKISITSLLILTMSSRKKTGQLQSLMGDV